MKAYEEYQRKLRDLAEAKEYLSKIGKDQPHFRSGDLGKLHGVDVKTTICWQASPGSTNYWNGGAFDKALGRVVRERFEELRDAALAKMENDVSRALIDCKTLVLGLVDEIEAAEANKED